LISLILKTPEVSENIEVMSILDRYLKLGRVYLFSKGGKNEMDIGTTE